LKKIVVLTGAGISAESGLKTFRDSNGLWEGHDVMEVASPQGWDADMNLLLHFYNERRKQALTATPNNGHYALAKLEQSYEVTIITQNVDALHEKAGSSNVLHLHGELFKVRSTIDPSLNYQLDGWELKKGDLCEKGSQLRPDIVWFGEAVPMMENAIKLALEADIFMVVGTSLQVYPAASLINYTRNNTPTYVIDPFIPNVDASLNAICYQEPATTGVPKAIKHIVQSFKN